MKFGTKLRYTTKSANRLGDCIAVRVHTPEAELYFFAREVQAALHLAQVIGYSKAQGNRVPLEDVPQRGSYDKGLEWARRYSGNRTSRAFLVQGYERLESLV